MDQTQAHAEAQTQAQAQALAEAQAARAKLEAYMTPELLDRDTDRRHRSFMSTVPAEDVGHVCCCTTRTLLPIHDRWVPKYMN
jgi:hypothetical protein